MGKAATKAQNKYIAKKYDRIPLVVPKGNKEKIQAYAASLIPKMSVNAYINQLIDADMKAEEK